MPQASPATSIKLRVGTNDHHFDLEPGVSRFSAPLSSGTVVLSAHDKTGRVLGVIRGERLIEDAPEVYNFNLCAVRVPGWPCGVAHARRLR